jgi:thymidylate synthase (FAD)
MIEVTLIDSGGKDLSVVNAARVSHKKRHDEYVVGKDDSLLSYLRRHGHMTPFNHAWMSFHVKAPIFVARQCVKHEYLPFNEVSRRYVSDPPEFFVPTEWREATTDKKQGSGGAIDNSTPLYDELLVAYKASEESYQNLLDSGVCEEQARMVLPLGLYTEWVWSGSLGAFAKFCRLRLAPDAQAETWQVANQIDRFATILFPNAWEEALHCIE